MSDKPEKRLAEVVREDGRYPLEAFGFLLDGMHRAAKEIYGEAVEEDALHHVSGRQLCSGLRDEAKERWGMLAGTVLARWNVHSTLDFGEMVYLLVENDHMHTTEEDSLEDFRDVYDFEEAFGPGEIFKT